MDYTFGKSERLKSEKQIKAVFANGHSYFAFPVKLYALPTEQCPDNIECTQSLFTVSKKKFKRAVDRNKIKRRMREAFRLNAGTLKSGERPCRLAFVYIHDEILEYAEIEKAMIKLIRQLKVE